MVKKMPTMDEVRTDITKNAVAGMGHNGAPDQTFAAGQLRAIIERIERLEEEKRPSPTTSKMFTRKRKETVSTQRQFARSSGCESRIKPNARKPKRLLICINQLWEWRDEKRIDGLGYGDFNPFDDCIPDSTDNLRNGNMDRILVSEMNNRAFYLILAFMAMMTVISVGESISSATTCVMYCWSIK